MTRLLPVLSDLIRTKSFWSISQYQSRRTQVSHIHLYSGSRFQETKAKPFFRLCQSNDRDSDNAWEGPSYICDLCICVFLLPWPDLVLYVFLCIYAYLYFCICIASMTKSWTMFGRVPHMCDVFWLLYQRISGTMGVGGYRGCQQFWAMDLPVTKHLPIIDLTDCELYQSPQ